MKYIIVFVISFLLSNFTYAQQEIKWRYSDVPIVGHPAATDEGESKVNLKGFKNPYGIAVDAYDNLWFSAYNPRFYYADDDTTQIFPDDIDGKHTYPIFILKTDGDIDTLKFLNMPDGSVDTLLKGSRGMTTDVYGNIIHIDVDMVYQIDALSRSVLNSFQLPDQNQGVCPAADSLGYIYVTSLWGGGPLYILDAQNLAVINSIPSIDILKRNIAVSPDGRDIYAGDVRGTGLYHYRSDNGPFGTYTLDTTIVADSGNGIHYTQWDPEGLVWIGSVEGDPLNLLWALDPNDNYAIVDSVSFTTRDSSNSADTTTGGYPQPYIIRAPRDVAFSNDGKTMYLADFFGYTIKEFCSVDKVLRPHFFPPGGNYYASRRVGVKSNTPEAQIHYTLNGNIPTINSPLYSDSIVVDQSLTIKAIGFKQNLIQSDLGMAEYVLHVPNPVFAPDSGNYNVPQNVTISSAVDSVDIYYTLDGSPPDQSSLLYTQPILVDKPMIITAIGFRDGWIQSETVVAVYNIPEQIIDLEISFDDIWYDTDFNGSEMNVIDASQSSVPYGSIESFIWTMDNDTVATIADPVLQLYSGMNKLILTVTTDQGKSKQDTIGISVIVNKIKTQGGIYAAVSQLDSNNYFVSSFDDRIYQFDSTGVVRWTILTGGKVQSTNCINSDEVIFVGSSDTRIYSFDKDGTPNWDKAMGGIILSSPSFGPSNNIYFGVSTGRVFSVSETGNIMWNFQSGGSVLSSPAISEEEHIFFGSSDGKIYAVDTAGVQLWSYQTGDSIVSSPAIGNDSTLVIGSNDSSLYKIDLTGQLNWEFSTGGSIRCSPAIGSDGNIYFGSADGYVYSVDNNGNENWKFNANSPVNGSPSLDSHENIFIGCDDGRLLVLDNQGNFKWYLKTDNNLVAPPLITGNDVIYVGSMDGNIYIIKNKHTSMLKPAYSGILEWPTFKGNNRRTGFKGDVKLEQMQDGYLIPENYILFQNYPNPFNSTTTIKIGLPKGSKVDLSFYNILGQKINTIQREYTEAGYYEINFNISNLSTGIYIYTMETKEFRKSKKMVLIK